MARSAASTYYRMNSRALSDGLSGVESGPEDLRAREDFAYFCERITGSNGNPKIQPPHMAEWNRLIFTGEDSKVLKGIAGPHTSIRAPRGAAKSHYIGFLAAWLIGVFALRQEHLPILYVSYTVDVARAKSAAIKSIIESVEYQRIFPCVRKGKKWSDENWEIDYAYAKINVIGEDAFTLWCAGLKGAILSKRAKLVLLDDIIKSPESIENPDIREDMARNWTRGILPTIFEGGRAIHIGNLQRPDDIQVTHFNEACGWKVATQSALLDTPEGEKSYWPAMWSLSYLLGMRDTDPVGFALQYQNKIIRVSENSIDPEWILKGEPPLDIYQYDRLVVGGDLSSSQKERNDFTVFVLAGRIGNTFHILDMWRGKEIGNITKLDRLIEVLYDWGIVEPIKDAVLDDGTPKYGSIGVPIWFCCEDVAYQSSMAGDFRTHMHQRHQLHDIIYRKAPAKGDKISRLRGITGLFQNKMVQFNAYRSLGPLYSELVGFGTEAHDDCVDAIGYALTPLRKNTSLDIG